MEDILFRLRHFMGVGGLILGAASFTKALQTPYDVAPYLITSLVLLVIAWKLMRGCFQQLRR